MDVGGVAGGRGLWVAGEGFNMSIISETVEGGERMESDNKYIYQRKNAHWLAK